MDRRKIEQGVRLLLEGIGEDLSREGLRETPGRVVEMLSEICSGVGQTPELDSGFNAEIPAGQAVLIRNLDFYSLCEHHLLPFFGTVDILYIPRGGQVAGFSSLAQVVEVLARRPQIQERLTQQIAQAIYQGLSPEGVLVQVQARHLCLSMRGQRKQNARVCTQTVLGTLQERHFRLLEASSHST